MCHSIVEGGGSLESLFIFALTEANNRSFCCRRNGSFEINRMLHLSFSIGQFFLSFCGSSSGSSSRRILKLNWSETNGFCHYLLPFIHGRWLVEFYFFSFPFVRSILLAGPDWWRLVTNGIRWKWYPLFRIESLMSVRNDDYSRYECD